MAADPIESPQINPYDDNRTLRSRKPRTQDPGPPPEPKTSVPARTSREAHEVEVADVFIVRPASDNHYALVNPGVLRDAADLIGELGALVHRAYERGAILGFGQGWTQAMEAAAERGRAA